MPDSGVDSTARSGACVLLARWAASAPSEVTELTSPSPRNSRAMQAMISSSMLYSGIRPSPSHSEALAQGAFAAEGAQILLVAHVHVPFHVFVPARAVARR